jgi:ketosteroid isomerase-like protein
MRDRGRLRIVRPACAGFVLLLTLGCGGEERGGSNVGDETPAALEDRQAAFLAALASLDADRVGALFEDDAVLHVANMPAITGGEAIREFYRNVFGFMAATEATTEILRGSEADDIGYASGSTANEFRGPDGPVRYAGKFLVVWRKVGEEWRVAAYAISSDAPEGPS